MGKRHLLFYNDARHGYMYCYDPPMRLEDARAPIDEVAGTSVDTFVYGFGAGPTMFHNTRVGEIWGQRFGRFKSQGGGAVYAWRAYENIKSLIDRGLDPLNVLIDRAHEKGIEFFASLRQSHSIDPKEVENHFNWQFRIDHPEWCLKGPGRHCFNWVHPEVRAERFALIEETVTRYDVDGFEVDWVFDAHYFEPNQVEANAHILTEYMGEVRRVVDDSARKRGRPIALGARVLPTPAGNQKAGLDVAAWIEGDLLDFVVPNVYGDLQMDSDLPFEWLVKQTRSNRCEVYPALQSRVESHKEQPAGLEHYYAGATAYWTKGADGLYLPWFAWPVQTEGRHILSMIADPELTEEQPKHYVVRRQSEVADQHGYSSPLPLPLTTGLDAAGQTVPLYVADDSKKVRATLRLRLNDTTTHDSMTVSLNGQPLATDTCWRTTIGYLAAWLDYPLPRGVLHRGRNVVGVAVHRRPDNLAGQVILESVELKVEYPPQEPQ